MRAVYYWWGGRHTFFAFWIVIIAVVLVCVQRISGGEFVATLTINQTLLCAKDAHEAHLMSQGKPPSATVDPSSS